MEVTQPPLPLTLNAENKRQCIKIKARIKVHGEASPSQPAAQTEPQYQAYCETIASSRTQSPDIFSIPPSRQTVVQSTKPSTVPTYTARISPRKRAAQGALVVQPPVSRPERHNVPPTSPKSDKRSSKQGDVTNQGSEKVDTTLTGQYHNVSQSTTPRGSHIGTTTELMSRNDKPSQLQQDKPLPIPAVQVITARTPLRQKRYGRMDYHPLPPLPPKLLERLADDKHEVRPTTVNFSRGEIKGIHPEAEENAIAPHLTCVGAYIPPPSLPPPTLHDAHSSATTAGHERPQSKASRRTVTFADDTTISSRSSSPDRRSKYFTPDLRQSKSFSNDVQISSSLRLYSSHDSLLVEVSDQLAPRRTIPKDHKHQYTFGQRPESRLTSTPGPGLGRTSNAHYNPRLSTSKAEYRSLQTLPIPLPASLRAAEPQTGPRQPPWGSLEDLEERRDKRLDARERDQARKFRSAVTSQSRSEGSTDSFGQEKMKKEVEEYKEQVMSVYPDMAFDGSAGKGGRSCCCVVM